MTPPVSPGASNPASPESNTNPSTPSKNTTGKTSMESKASSKETVIVVEKKVITTAAITSKSSPEGTDTNSLTTIQETALDVVSPSIVTVELAAAAKIYLETHFNSLIGGPTPRSTRRNALEAELYHAITMTLEEKDARRKEFYRVETEHLRELRALRTKSIRSLRMPLCQGNGIGGLDGSETPPSARRSHVDDYEVVKILGKGSFGVVKLVREKKELADKRHGQGLDGIGDKKEPKAEVLAMKVIRKSDMLRSSQEGHLRAERDFLVASEGSSW
jgi:protein-serine/threonine kinase